MKDKADLLKWFNSLSAEKIPNYVEVEKANANQVYLNGNWQNIVYIWSVFADGNEWFYVETDTERGYVSVLKSFGTETEAIEYAKETLNRHFLAFIGNSKEEMLCRYIVRKYGYLEDKARTMIDKMKKHTDIFDEFFNYARIGRFEGKDGTKVTECGYTAEALYSSYRLSPLGVYNQLVFLREAPEQALGYLEKGLPKK